ncbi:hypothetical protein GDO81_000226 [Engystomops pustulosus]|uniref:Uncharacterized protein n=1 Tax=Engystomops pustulosus TaxID=76066 RepID=A0AAV7D3V2_ENGPU|nr:hypothetical protein GDO81_000226 [Engystomops pustulosus]
MFFAKLVRKCPSKIVQPNSTKCNRLYSNDNNNNLLKNSEAGNHKRVTMIPINTWGLTYPLLLKYKNYCTSA